jgi:hypothetical protein
VALNILIRKKPTAEQRQ